jgi:UDP-2-acetamido-3-amino-2,3-dideoxy-glucuronate N-acetyltransferase
MVKRGVTIGANATIVCGITLGEYAFIGAGSVVKADVLPYAIVVGVPAKHIGFMCKCGLKLSFNQDKYAQCSCGLGYKLVDDNCQALYD